jgi:hypothetical protein
MKRLFFLSFIVGCGVSSKPAKEIIVETQPTVVVEQSVVENETPDLQRIAYDIGYKRGYKNFTSQMNLEPTVESKEFAYTVKKEDEAILETEAYQDIMMKGYVDGYHKAGESMVQGCPRKN